MYALAANANGLFGMFPGVPVGTCAEYDPRFRPWYAAAAQVPKNVVIMIDSGTSMQDKNWTIVAKNAISTILNTLNPDDAFNVVDFDETPRTKSSQNEFDKCASDHLISATPLNIEMITEWCVMLHAPS